jgi:hypothetical protein
MRNVMDTVFSTLSLILTLLLYEINLYLTTLKLIFKVSDSPSFKLTCEWVFKKVLKRVLLTPLYMYKVYLVIHKRKRKITNNYNIKNNTW